MPRCRPAARSTSGAHENRACGLSPTGGPRTHLPHALLPADLPVQARSPDLGLPQTGAGGGQAIVSVPASSMALSRARSLRLARRMACAITGAASLEKPDGDGNRATGGGRSRSGLRDYPGRSADRLLIDHSSRARGSYPPPHRREASVPAPSPGRTRPQARERRAGRRWPGSPAASTATASRPRSGRR